MTEQRAIRHHLDNSPVNTDYANTPAHLDADHPSHNAVHELTAGESMSAAGSGPGAEATQDETPPAGNVGHVHNGRQV